MDAIEIIAITTTPIFTDIVTYCSMTPDSDCY